jgi:small-conductance mechanosensitive channel
VNGYVRAIRLRSTTIQTPDNILLIVPNADLVGRTIVNWSHGDPKMRIRLGIGVAYASDLDRVQDAMRAAALAHPGTLKEPVPEVRLVATSDSALEFQALVWIPDPRERGRIESDLRLDIVKRFRQAGITIPFPQREVRILGEASQRAGSGES